MSSIGEGGGVGQCLAAITVISLVCIYIFPTEVWMGVQDISGTFCCLILPPLNNEITFSGYCASFAEEICRLCSTVLNNQLVNSNLHHYLSEQQKVFNLQIYSVFYLHDLYPRGQGPQLNSYYRTGFSKLKNELFLWGQKLFCKQIALGEEAARSYANQHPPLLCLCDCACNGLVSCSGYWYHLETLSSLGQALGLTITRISSQKMKGTQLRQCIFSTFQH